MQFRNETKEYAPAITGAEREIFCRELLEKILPITN